MNSRIFWILIISLISLGCSRRDPEPQNSDPIYLDLVKEQRALEQVASDTDKQIETAKKDLVKSEPRSMDRKTAESDLLKYETKRQKMIELSEYYKIRVIRRAFEAKQDYDAAFNRGRPWPDKNEYTGYLENKKLQLSSRNWSDRVPKADPKNLKKEAVTSLEKEKKNEEK